MVVLAANAALGKGFAVYFRRNDGELQPLLDPSRRIAFDIVLFGQAGDNKTFVPCSAGGEHGTLTGIKAADPPGTSLAAP
jgi:hypothetical protein